MDCNSLFDIVHDDASPVAGRSSKLAALPSNAIAIVGMAFRFPGDMVDELSFWEALRSGQDLVSEIPSDRWAVDELQHPKRSESGRSITFSAGVLSRIEAFDAQFFGISPREAALLDPQQRLLLELAWEALENSGQVPSALAGSKCAVYVGISGLDYGMRLLDDLSSLTTHMMTGNTMSVVANRLSYVFDLHGPSQAVDTACSSSLVALHHACNSLRHGEAESALVGGVNLLLHPYPFVGFTKASMLSAQGRCKAFDASGDGYVRAEGGAVLYLKPLAKALADGDDIQAVIRATGVNADGARKSGLTIPSAAGQIELMRAVLEQSGLSPLDVDFVEAHGTGTAVGDPIEATAIGTVYGQGRPQGRPLPIGSVKTNLGHMEPASGMAGLIKAVLALKHRALPPSLHFTNPNPRIDFFGLKLDVVTRHRELTRTDGKPLVAGVNSFGFGGANAHVLLQEAPAKCVDSRPREVASEAPPLFISARTQDALRDMAARYARLLSVESDEHYYDIAHGAVGLRERMEKRLAIKADNSKCLAELLDRFAQGEVVEHALVEEILPAAGGVAFIYSGNGAQWAGMGQQLLQESPRFAAIIGQIDATMSPFAGFSVMAELQAEKADSRLDDTVIAQPLLFAIQVAVTQLLKEQGIEPTAVTGHSVGEVAAAWASGALELEQAIRVVCVRSTEQGLTRGSGRMAAVAMSPAGIEAVLRDLGGDLDIEVAGINSANNVTLSGDLVDLERIQSHLEPMGIFFRLLDLDYAFHSRQMDSIEQGIVDGLADLAPAASKDSAFVSAVTGDIVPGNELVADYWWHNVRQPVRFAEAMARLVELGCRVFIEVGPHAILQRYIGECLKTAEVSGRVLPTLRRDDDGLARLEEAALRAHLLADVPKLDVYFPVPGKHVRLPNYPWQRERHWYAKTSESHALIERQRVHPLLGWRLSEAEAAWENTLDPLILPWLADHQVGGAVVFPGAAYAEMALAAAREWHGKESLGLEEMDILAPLVFDGEHARTLRLTLNTRDGGFQITSRQRLSHDEWTLHATGRLFEVPANISRQSAIHPASVDARLVDRATHYDLTARLGLDYGSAFQGLREARVADELLDAQTDVPQSVREDGYLLHPAMLDLCYQSLVDYFQVEIESGQGIAFLPVKIGRLTLHRMARVERFRARLLRRSARSVLADFELLDAEGALVASMHGCRFRAAPLLKREKSPVARWKITPRLRPHPADLQVTHLPSTAELGRHLADMFEGGEATLQRQAWFKEALPLLEALTLAFAYEAFETPHAAHANALQERIEQQGASAYLRWLTALLIGEQLLVEHEGRWQLAPRGELPRAEDIWQTLLRESSACASQLVLLGRVGRHLAELLGGELDMREFIHGLRRSPSSETLLDDDPAYLGTRLAIQTIVQELERGLPGHRKLRILEISPGTSELARRVSSFLGEDRLEYALAITDEEARLRQQLEFQEMPRISVLGLDLADWNLASDIADAQPFDVVILHHVAHRTAFPQAALAHARRWLAQGGLLMVAERYPDWSADMLGGLDSGWWSEADGGSRSRPLSALQPPEAWHNALVEAGFEGIERFSEPASEGFAVGAYLVLAKRPAGEVEPSVCADRASWLVLVDSASAALAGQLRLQLEAEGQHVIVCEQMNSAELALADHVVHMLGWSASSPVEGLSAALRMPGLVHQLLDDGTRQPRLWMATHGGALADVSCSSVPAQPHQGALWGFGRVLMNEYPALDCTLIDVACDPGMPGLPLRMSHEFLQPDGANGIVLNAEGRYVLSMSEDTTEAAVDAGSSVPRYRLDFRVPGQLRNLAWLPENVRELRDHEVEVNTRATGLNFRDVMYLMGLLPDEAVENGFAGASLGLEFSGVVSRVGRAVRDYAPGDAVMGFGSSCFASHVVTRADAIAAMPEGWSFASAATVPTVFFTVYYALRQLADLQPGERVLIHGAAGGVGIAAIQLARHLGVEIFATAGSEEKRDFVKLLGADHVFDSRSLAFADDILEATNGEGVDVVLNSLAGEAIRRNLRILKPFGRFLELGKRDFFENTPIGLRPFKDNISYFGIDADQLLTGRPALAARLFREVMELFHEGVLAPLPHRVFTADRVVDAFRVMQQARHIGKVIVSLDEPPSHIERPVEPCKTLTFAKDSTWLVTGGLSGFGLETARWLAARGVGHLVLLGRSGVDTPGAKDAISAMQAQGVEVLPLACDIIDAAELSRVMQRIHANMPPLKGVVHAAMVIDDALIANLDGSRMENVLKPKLLGAWNLHMLTRDIQLDHFVLYSSVTTYIGNPGQANYVAANAALESLTRMRRCEGMPATCIGWGPIGDAGYLTRNEAVRDSLEQRLGKPPLSSAEALEQLEQMLLGDQGPRAIANFDWAVLSRLLASSGSTRFDALNRQLGEVSAPDHGTDIRTLIADKAPEEVRRLVRELVIHEVSQILSISAERIEPNRSLHDLGMDSLMAVELALGLEQRFGIQLPVMMLNESPTAERVTARIIERLLGGDEQAAEGGESFEALVRQAVQQHGVSMSGDDVQQLANEARIISQGTQRGNG